MQEYDYARLLYRLIVHQQKTQDMRNAVHDAEDAYYRGKQAGLDEAVATMTDTEHGTSRQQADCPYCHPDKDGIITPLVDKDSVTVTVKPRDGLLLVVTDFGTMTVTIWYCPACGRRVKAFIHEKQLPE